MANLPYIHIWLPLVIGVVICVPALIYLLRKGPEDTATETGPPQPADVPQVVDPFTHGSRTEKRQAARRQGNVIKLLCAVPDAVDQPFHGYVVDRSMTGLRILLPHPYALDTVLLIRPASLSIPWVKVEVRNCAASNIQSGEYEAGCQFVGSPSYATLQMFG